MEHSLKINWNNTYIEICKLISKHSKCKRKKVGCILVKDNRIISIGYNGTPSKFCNICEKNNKTLQSVIHAESNALMKCAKSVESSNGADLYCTLSPCYDCCKLIIQSGIKNVYFNELYNDISGLQLLKKAKIKYEKI